MNDRFYAEQPWSMLCSAYLQEPGWGMRCCDNEQKSIILSVSLQLKQESDQDKAHVETDSSLNTYRGLWSSALKWNRITTWISMQKVYIQEWMVEWVTSMRNAFAR